MKRTLFITSRDVRWVAMETTFLVLLSVLNGVLPDPDSRRLYHDLFVKSDYNKNIRPRPHRLTNATTVKLGISLTQLVNVDVKNQIITTNVFVEQEWEDYKLRWNPSDYANISRMYVPPQDIWTPDVVLYNSADGNFTVKRRAKIAVHHTGVMKWRPPAVYLSLCEFNIAFFPFDEQTCYLKLGSWTFDGFKVDIRHQRLKDEESSFTFVQDGINLQEFSESTEWDVIDVPAQKYNTVYPCCPEPFQDIKFNITIRRKPLFYITNVILPCVSMCCVTVLVFFLPSRSLKKISMAITVMNSLIVFLLLIIEITPPISSNTPLFGKYIVFTMVLIVGSIAVSVFVIHLHFQCPVTHTLSPWMRELFFCMLPRLLLMRPPRVFATSSNQGFHRDLHSNTKHVKTKNTIRQNLYDNYEDFQSAADDLDDVGSIFTPTSSYQDLKKLPKHLMYTMVGVSSIADYLQRKEESKKVKADWHFVAQVMDRLFLWVFVGSCLIGTLGILIQAPSLYDRRPALKAEILDNECTVSGCQHFLYS